MIMRIDSHSGSVRSGCTCHSVPHTPECEHMVAANAAMKIVAAQAVTWKMPESYGGFPIVLDKSPDAPTVFVRDRCPSCGVDFAEFPEMRHTQEECGGPECSCYEAAVGHQPGCSMYVSPAQASHNAKVRWVIKDVLKHLAEKLGKFEQTCQGTVGDRTFYQITQQLAKTYEKPNAYNISTLCSLINQFAK